MNMQRPLVSGMLRAQLIFDELEKISNVAGGVPLPTMATPQGPTHVRPAPVQTEAGPVQEALGAHVEPIDKKRARGVPIVPPPPGYTYAPQLHAFVPNEQEAGWMTRAQAAIAQGRAMAFRQGYQMAVQRAAQDRAELHVQRNMQNNAQHSQQAALAQRAQQIRQAQQVQRINRANLEMGVTPGQASSPPSQAAQAMRVAPTTTAAQ